MRPKTTNRLKAGWFLTNVAVTLAVTIVVAVAREVRTDPIREATDADVRRRIQALDARGELE